MAVGIENPSKTIVCEPRAHGGKDLKVLLCTPPIAVGAECPFKKKTIDIEVPTVALCLYIFIILWINLEDTCPSFSVLICFFQKEFLKEKSLNGSFFKKFFHFPHLLIFRPETSSSDRKGEGHAWVLHPLLYFTFSILLHAPLNSNSMD
jgi:hypothetical protein